MDFHPCGPFFVIFIHVIIYVNTLQNHEFWRDMSLYLHSFLDPQSCVLCFEYLEKPSGSGWRRKRKTGKQKEKEIWRKTKIILTFEIGSATLLVESCKHWFLIFFCRRKAKVQTLVTVIPERKEKVEIYNKVMTVKENMITTQK